jgi:hypothetical protein
MHAAWQPVFWQLSPPLAAVVLLSSHVASALTVQLLWSCKTSVQSVPWVAHVWLL